jgi:hypothetical protein
LKTERFMDVRLVHGCGAWAHGGSNVGVHTVYVNSRYIQIWGDPVDCGSTQVVCSGDVFVE